MAGLAFLAGLAALPTPAAAQTEHLEEMRDNAHAGAEVRGSNHRSLLVVPIPMSNPSLGSGLTLAGVMFYNPNNSPQPWVTGVAGLYTSNKSWGVGAFHSMRLANDRFRVIALAGYADVNIEFFGIGPNAGIRNRSVELNERGFAAGLQAQMRVAPHLYVGGRYQYLRLKTRIDNPDPRFPDLDIPPAELDTTLSAVGPSISWDSRDNSLNPRNGILATGAWMFSIRDLGSSFSYDKLQLAANFYYGARPGTVLAARVSACGVSRGGPFYDLCLYGSGGDLRGYEAGRYRDRASWAAQVEIRQHLFGRFGAVLFGGVGGIAPNLGSLGDSTILPAGGVGLRFMPSPRAGINLRLDYAIGRDSHALYFSIGEAF